MAKYYGMIGFSIQKETRPGVWQEVTHEHPVYGDIYRHEAKTENGGTVNDNVVKNSQISFIADPFANEHSANIKYATDMFGVKWRVKAVDFEYPRLILTLGDVYND